MVQTRPIEGEVLVKPDSFPFFSSSVAPNIHRRVIIREVPKAYPL